MSADQGPITGAALLRWIELDLPQPPWPEREPFVGFVYLDPQAGLSAKGGRAGDPGQPERPALTLRAPFPGLGRVLEREDAQRRGMPDQPGWLLHFGEQPPADGPWRSDPALAGLSHPAWPDDVQVLIHDGEPRRTDRAPELCWVRVVGAEPGPARPPLSASGAAPHARIYLAALLNRPHGLRSLRLGDRLRFYADPGGGTPLMVTPAYVAERARWQIEPCRGCGLAEGLDPPSVMARTRFAGTEAPPVAFTAHCALCGGVQQLRRIDTGA